MIKQLLRKNFVLIAILLAALFIRVIGVNPGYPPYHPDEPMSYGSAINMVTNGNLDPKRYDYPAGVPLIHWFLYRTFFLPVSLLKIFFPHPRVFLTALRIGNRFFAEFSEPIFGHREIKALFWSRYITAFLGTFCVFLTYLIAKRLFKKTAALVSAFLLAFNFRHVLSSHFALSDIPNNFFALLAVYSCLLLLEKNSRRNYLLSGITCALYLSMKYQFFPIVTFIFVHLIWVVRKKTLKELFNKNFVVSLFLIPVIFSAINPYLLINLKTAIPIIKYVGMRYQMGIRKFSFYPFFYLYHWAINPSPFLMIVGGLFLGLFFEPLKTLFLGSFIFPFFFIMTYYSGGGILPRNFINVIPFLFIFAGFFFTEILRLIKKISHAPSYIMTLIFLIFVIWVNLRPIRNSTTLSYFYTKPWSLTKLSIWLTKNLPENVKVSSHSVVNFPEGREIDRRGWPIWGETSMKELQEEGNQFAVMNTSDYHVLLYEWFNLPYKEMIKYSGIPYEFFSNTFYGLVLEEWLNYSVEEFFKPWQAYDLNYLVFKIPSILENSGKKLITFDFNEKDENWLVKDKFGQETKGFVWNKNEGHFKKGSLEIGSNANGFSTARFSSLPIPVKPGEYYTFSGWIKNSDNLDSRNRDGFLRMDFYRDKADAQISKNRLKIALSGRVFGATEWVKKQATAVSPKEASYVVLSFQRNNLSSGFSSFLDDIILFESNVLPKENFPEIPYIKTKISEEELYPNSIL